MTEIIDVETLLSEIENRLKQQKGNSTGRRELEGIKIFINKEKVSNELALLSKKGKEARAKNSEPYYEKILPIIDTLQKEGYKTAYAITNKLNAMGEKTVRGKAFRDVITKRYMEKLKKRQG